MKVGIIGLGYVGLPLAVAFAEAGSEVVGLDVDSRVVAELNAGRSAVEDVDDATLAALGERLSATADVAELADCDAVLICVPTPLANQREPDLSYVLDAGRALAAVLREGQVVVLESTTYPGTTRDRLLPILEESGLTAGEQFHLAFSPERIDPGRTDYTIRTTPKVVGGLTAACTRARRGRLRADLRAGRARLDPGGRRVDEAAREHLPLGQHRARQRARDPQRPDGDRHLGGRRRRGDEAVRLHALRARARDGRPLPSRRPVLPRVQGARVRLPRRVRRARRQGQPPAAALLRRADRPRPQRRRQVGPRIADPDPRRLLQGRDRRHPRVAGAAGDRAAAGARRRDLVPRSARPGATGARARVGPARRGGRRRRRRLRPHRPPGARLRRRSSPAPGSSSISAA